MISRRVLQKPENDDYRRLASYIAAADHPGEKSLMRWCSGCLAGDDYTLGIQEAVDTQAMNTRTSKEKTYHLIVSFRPEDEARLTPEVFKVIEEEFARALGFSEHQRHCGVHKNTNNLHMHVAYNMIHPERLIRNEPYRDFHKRDQVCRELERRFGLAIDNGRGVEKNSPKLNDIAATVEAHTGQQSFEGYAKERRERLLDDLAQAADWELVHVTLARHGLEIKPHGNGLVIKDRHGDHAIKASSLDRSLSLAKLTRRIGAFAPPRQAQALYPEIECFTAKPLHRGAERGDLYQEYQRGIELRKMAMNELANHKAKDLEDLRVIWNQEREKIHRQFFGRHRYDLLKIARLKETEQRLLIQKRIRAEQDKRREEVPYASWTDFLRWKATQGNETALAILRSKGDLVESEASLRDSGIDRRQEVREKWIGTQLDLVAGQDVSRRARRGLLAVAKAHELAELESVGPRAKRLFTEFTSSIDARGTVFIHLANGGMIRDMGKEIAFTAHDDTTQEAALLFARAKWGKAVRLEGNVLRMQPRKQELHANKKDLLGSVQAEPEPMRPPLLREIVLAKKAWDAEKRQLSTEQKTVEAPYRERGEHLPEEMWKAHNAAFKALSERHQNVIHEIVSKYSDDQVLTQEIYDVLKQNAADVDAIKKESGALARKHGSFQKAPQEEQDKIREAYKEAEKRQADRLLSIEDRLLSEQLRALKEPSAKLVLPGQTEQHRHERDKDRDAGMDL